MELEEIPQFIKKNIHITSFKSKTFIRKEISPHFSFADLVPNPKITDQQVHQISRSLAWLKATKVVKLDFTNSKQLTDHAFFSIAEGFKKLSSVNTLIINLTG